MNIDKQSAKSSFLIFSWSLYDLANQFFVLIVVSLYFLSPWADAGYRAALLSLIIFMALGIIFLLRLKNDK